MVEANRLADDPEPADPSSVSLREPPVGGSHAIRLHPQGEKELAGEALVVVGAGGASRLAFSPPAPPPPDR